MSDGRGGGRRQATMMETGLMAQLSACFWREGSTRDVWMLTDAARDSRVYGLLLECFYSTHRCLYADKLTPELKTVAPYLVPLEQDGRKSQKFISYAWTNSWGVFLKCDTGPDTLKRHLRAFLKVQTPAGRRVLFRFYDPRVLRTYLPTCNAEELASFFGPIECFWLESETPERVLEYRFSGGSLVQRTLSLAPGTAYPNLVPEPRRAGIRSLQELPRMRPEQMQAFSRAEVRKFERWMCDHLLRHFPVQCQSMDDLALAAFVQAGVVRATRHRITVERDVCKFIDLMLVFGPDFDTDERLAWAGEILASRMAPSGKVQALFAAGEEHLRRR